MSVVPPPAASPQPPKPADGTTQPGVASTFYVKAKLAEAEERIAATAAQAAAEESARAALEVVRSESIGKPVVSPKLTPWFIAGFVLCGAVVGAVSGDPMVPLWVVKAATVGTTFFGGMLSIGPGLRKRTP